MLPLLDLYLGSHAAASGSGTPQGLDASSETAAAVSASSQAEKEAFQRRVLRLLGRLGGRNQAILRGGAGEGGDEDDEDAAALAAGAGTQGALLLTLPFAGAGVEGDGAEPMEVEIDVGALLPRLQALASQRGEAQVKVMAAEAIHALVVFLVGTSATRLRAGAAGMGAGVDKRT